jgi:ubiquinone/menaquinone biosynthesis C-methylase UbiE
MLNFFKNRSSEQTRLFYHSLLKGHAKRGILNKENRFDPYSIVKKQSVIRHFLPTIQYYLSTSDKCLDLGCGPGGFLALMAPHCGTIVGADIVPDFIEECRSTIDSHSINNASAVLLDSSKLPFYDNEFDKVVMVDTIHHLENHKITLEEVCRILKPGGLLLILEPNKSNPLLAILCALDPNEHGLLRLGTFFSYRRILGSSFEVIHQDYNGMLVGPDGKISSAIADFVSLQGKSLLGWLSPKLFMVARKRLVS